MTAIFGSIWSGRLESGIPTNLGYINDQFLVGYYYVLTFTREGVIIIVLSETHSLKLLGEQYTTHGIALFSNVRTEDVY